VNVAYFKVLSVVLHLSTSKTVIYNLQLRFQN